MEWRLPLPPKDPLCPSCRNLRAECCCAAQEPCDTLPYIPAGYVPREKRSRALAHRRPAGWRQARRRQRKSRRAARKRNRR